MSSPSGKKKNLRKSKSSSTRSRSTPRDESTNTSSSVSQVPDVVFGLGEIVNTFYRFDISEMWKMATSCVHETTLIAEQLGEPSTMIMNADVVNICNVLNNASLLLNGDVQDTQSWVPKEVTYVPGADEVSEGLTWNGSYMMEHAREILRREAERRARRRQSRSGSRSRRERRTVENGESSDEPVPVSSKNQKDYGLLGTTTTKSTLSTEMSVNGGNISKKRGDDTTRSRRSIFKLIGDDTTRSRRSIFNPVGDDTTRSRRSLFNPVGDDTARSLRRSIFNGVKTVQSKGAEFIQRRRERRSQKQRSSHSRKIPLPLASQ